MKGTVSCWIMQVNMPEKHQHVRDLQNRGGKGPFMLDQRCHLAREEHLNEAEVISVPRFIS